MRVQFVALEEKLVGPMAGGECGKVAYNVRIPPGWVAEYLALPASVASFLLVQFFGREKILLVEPQRDPNLPNDEFPFAGDFFAVSRLDPRDGRGGYIGEMEGECRFRILNRSGTPIKVVPVLLLRWKEGSSS